MYITERDSGTPFYTIENTDFTISAFRYVGMGYYNQPDYGDCSTIRVDNLIITKL